MKRKIVQSAYRAALSLCALLSWLVCATTVAAAQSQSAPQSARLYFLRQNALWGAGLRPSVRINGQEVGTVATGSYIVVARPAGRYTLRVYPPLPLNYFEVDVTVAAGKTYYFELGPATSPSGAGALLPIMAGNVGKRMDGRQSFGGTGWQFNSLDAATGAAEVRKLQAMPR